MLRIGLPASTTYYLDEIARQRIEAEFLKVELGPAVSFFPGGETAEFYLSAPEGEVAFGIRDGLGFNDKIYRRLISGKSNSGRTLRQKQGGDAVPGFELLFPAPKPLSVSWALAATAHNENAAKLFWRAHISAVRATLNFFAQNLATTRTGRHGTQEIAQGAIAGALFHHYDSRPEGEQLGDPHLHTHAVIYNSHFDGQKCRTLNSKYFLRSDAVFLLGQAYQKAVSDALVGAKIPITFVRETNNLLVPHVVGLPVALLDEFSRRKAEITKFAKTTGESKRYAALKTRNAKRSNITAQWAAWRQSFSRYRLSLGELSRLWETMSREQLRLRKVSPTKSLWSRLLRGGSVSILEALTEAIRLSSGDPNQPIDRCYNSLLASPLVEMLSEHRYRGGVKLTGFRRINRAIKKVKRDVGELFLERMRLANARDYSAWLSASNESGMADANHIVPGKTSGNESADEKYTPHKIGGGLEFYEEDFELKEAPEAGSAEGPSMKP
ncbi:MobF family relaxase [Ferrovibrio sp.]|uniref:MobF family relaxase n=1 Tax=Ferrovibrio sp. TaxID=1917215 RepID=UPI00351311F6